MTKLVLQLTTVALAITACANGAAATEVPETPANFAGSEWVLKTLYGTEAVPGTTITLKFKEIELGGFAGCNSYGAPYTATSQGSLAVSEVERTDEGCLEPEGVLLQEGVFEQALLSTVQYDQSPGTLIFFDDVGHAVLEFVTPQQVAEPTEVPEPVASALWAEAIDERTGLRFSVPCFWEVNIPSGEQDPTGLGSFNVRNYDEAFVMAHPRGIISEDEGAVKIDFTYADPTELGLSPGVGLDDFAQTLAGPEGESGIIKMVPNTVNGHDALNVTQESVFGLGYFTVIALEDDLYLNFSSSAFASDDVQGVLQSIAYAPDVSVVVPSFDPADAPLGVDAQCMSKQFSTAAEDLSNVLDCDGVIQGSAESLACDVQTALLARDMQSLTSFMADPFTIGYWGSEGGWASPEHMVRELDNARLPEDTSGLTFTTDRALFPPLAGAPPEQMFGPDLNPVLMIYSEGWGPDGLGAGVLYLVEDDSGAHYWSNLAYSHKHFDR